LAADVTFVDGGNPVAGRACGAFGAGCRAFVTGCTVFVTGCGRGTSEKNKSLANKLNVLKTRNKTTPLNGAGHRAHLPVLNTIPKLAKPTVFIGVCT